MTIFHARCRLSLTGDDERRSEMRRSSRVVSCAGIVARMRCHQRVDREQTRPLADPRSRHSHMGRQFLAVEIPSDFQGQIASRDVTMHLYVFPGKIVRLKTERRYERFDCRNRIRQ